MSTELDKINRVTRHLLKQQNNSTTRLTTRLTRQLCKRWTGGSQENWTIKYLGNRVTLGSFIYIVIGYSSTTCFCLFFFTLYARKDAEVEYNNISFC